MVRFHSLIRKGRGIGWSSVCTRCHCKISLPSTVANWPLIKKWQWMTCAKRGQRRHWVWVRSLLTWASISNPTQVVKTSQLAVKITIRDLLHGLSWPIYLLFSWFFWKSWKNQLLATANNNAVYFKLCDNQSRGWKTLELEFALQTSFSQIFLLPSKF